MTKTKKTFSPIVLSERIFLVVLTIGIVLVLLNVSQGKGALAFAFCGLGITSLIYFLVWPVLDMDVKISGFLKYLVISLPKAIWLSAAMLSFGIFLYLINFSYDYYAYFIGIGSTTIAMVFFIVLILWVLGQRQLKPFGAILVRAVPIFIVGLYIFFN